jgi:uncharacterized protein YjiS (DUF1127 family)
MNTIVRKSINNFDLSHLLAEVFATVWVWNFRWQSRLQLADLDNRTLEDIGISRKAANSEAQKAFWK